LGFVLDKRLPGESRDPMSSQTTEEADAVCAVLEVIDWVPAFAGMTD
jgi:hypothetical protein